MTTRRQILKSALAPIVARSVVLGQRAGAVAPSDKIVFGGIGIGARGEHDLSKLLNFSQARFVAVCDVRNERREAVKSMVDQKYGNHDCQMYDDHYALLARPDIDAVLIATGDRWHTPLAILAAQHGKDVYCEKPCSMSIEESRALADAFRRYNRIYQAGCQNVNAGSSRKAATMPAGWALETANPRTTVARQLRVCWIFMAHHAIKGRSLARTALSRIGPK